MTKTSSPANQATSLSETTQPVISPWRCFGGSVVAGGLATALFMGTQSIAYTFASKPIHSSNITVHNISAAVRTLVVGMVALGAGVFSLAAFGLAALGIQLLVQKMAKPSPSTDR